MQTRFPDSVSSGPPHRPWRGQKRENEKEVKKKRESRQPVKDLPLFIFPQPIFSRIMIDSIVMYTTVSNIRDEIQPLPPPLERFSYHPVHTTPTPP